MTHLKPLPEDITLPEHSILNKQDYERMYYLASQEKHQKQLQSLKRNQNNIDEIFEDTEYQPLIDAGLAVRNTGAGNPYIQLTAPGEVLAELEPEQGIRELIQGEHEAEEEYSSDS